MTLFRRQLYRITTTAMGTAFVLTATQGAVAEPTSTWASPIAARLKITSPYGGRHTGVDFAVPTGTPVRSVGPGRVVLASWSGNYGKAVTIRMTDGRYTLYTHLSRISVRVGQRVRAQKRVGYSGATGRVTGPHLHFEVRARRGYGSDINPLRYLARHGVRLSLRAIPHDHLPSADPSPEPFAEPSAELGEFGSDCLPEELRMRVEEEVVTGHDVEGERRTGVPGPGGNVRDGEQVVVRAREGRDGTAE